MRQFDHHAGWHYAYRIRITELRSQQDQERTESLATGFDQIAGSIGDELVLARDGLKQAILSAAQVCRQPSLKLSVEDR